MGGGLLGVIGGLAVVALPWSLLGMLVGMFLVGPIVFRRGARRSVSLRGMLLGICCGLLFAAFRHDASQATKWAIAGAVIGILGVCGPFVLLTCLALLWGSRPYQGASNRQVAGWITWSREHDVPRRTSVRDTRSTNPTRGEGDDG